MSGKLLLVIYCQVFSPVDSLSSCRGSFLELHLFLSGGIHTCLDCITFCFCQPLSLLELELIVGNFYFPPYLCVIDKAPDYTCAVHQCQRLSLRRGPQQGLFLGIIQADYFSLWKLILIIVIFSCVRSFCIHLSSLLLSI